MKRSVVILAGEASGDLYGADLAQTLKTRLPEVEIYGVGGARMAEAGVHLVADSRAWGAIGVVESLKVAPKVVWAFQRVKRFLHATKPDLIVPIDFGAFNVPLCRWAKRWGLRVLYYIPPGSWRRDRQGADLPQCTDWIVTPFQWSAELLQAMGARAYWAPHPLLRLARPSVEKEVFCERLGLDPYRPVIALLPGSRRHEVRALTPLYARVADSIYSVMPEAQFVISVAPHLDPDWIHILWADGSRQWVPTEKHSVWNLLAHADVALVCSGTATLEAALLNTPMVIVYRGDWLMNLEYRLRRRRLQLRWIGLPNLILQRDVCPELIQEAASPESLTRALIKLLRDEATRAAQLQAFAEIRQALGEGQDLPEAHERVINALQGAL
ncbi:MAG: lipid-A-disaccharide synthase [Armatimonadetes bacterium]|jgi:lipid-A-disaccharide synthase|nr:MAG: lipid-A-disaccharide synthase [Armatimonadota bacterium]